MADPRAAAPLALELALDRLEAELAAELPAHVRACARAHAAAAPPPPAPMAIGRPAAASLALRAVAHPALASRGLALLRLAAPVLVEGDPAVARARGADRTWPDFAAFAAAHEAACRARFGRGFLELVHALHGAAGEGAADLGDPAAVPEAPPGSRAPLGSLGSLEPLEPPSGWAAPDRTVEPREIEAVWRDLARRHGAAGRLEIVPSAAASPRAFVVEPGREVVAVVPARVDTPAARFTVLHELGHGLASLLASEALPRAVDEAAAAYVGRAMEAPEHPWHSPLAVAARARRAVLAGALDAIERAGASPASLGPLAAVRPPPVLWRDPGAPASYVRAERLAEAWAADGGAAPLAERLARAAEAAARAAIELLLRAPR